MNEVITRLNEIEEKAQSIISDAKTRKDQMVLQLDQDRREIDQKFARAEQEKMSLLETQLKKDAARQIEEEQKATQAAITELEDHFSEDQDVMAEEVFRKLIGD